MRHTLSFTSWGKGWLQWLLRASGQRKGRASMRPWKKPVLWALQLWVRGDWYWLMHENLKDDHCSYSERMWDSASLGAFVRDKHRWVFPLDTMCSQYDEMMLIVTVLQKDHLEWKEEFRRKQLRVDYVWPSAQGSGMRKQLDRWRPQWLGELKVRNSHQPRSLKVFFKVPN